MNFFIFIFLCSTTSWALSTQKRAFNERIVGGQISYASEFPFTAAIYVTSTDASFFCGGTLITSEWILTAGQCVYDAVLFTIRLGTNSLQEDDSNLLLLATSDYVLNPDFNPETLEHDIALIKLRESIQLTGYRRPITYQAESETETGGPVIAIGWGQTSDEDPELAPSLRKVDLTAISNTECKITYGDQVTDDMVCAAGNFNEGICIGDTGSPLLERVGNVYRHVGVASFLSGNGCDSTDPSGYTRTSHYIDWIRNVTYIL